MSLRPPAALFWDGRLAEKDKALVADVNALAENGIFPSPTTRDERNAHGAPPLASAMAASS
jgi:hypothetical protein